MTFRCVGVWPACECVFESEGVSVCVCVQVYKKCGRELTVYVTVCVTVSEYLCVIVNVCVCV